MSECENLVFTFALAIAFVLDVGEEAIEMSVLAEIPSRPPVTQIFNLGHFKIYFKIDDH